MKLKQGFITHTIQDTQIMVAVGSMTERFHGLVRSNETAAFIVDALKEETTEEAIVDKLLAEYDVDRATAARDVHEILKKLDGIGAIEPAGAVR